MNKCVLIGNLTKDIELKFQAGSGLAIGKFSLAVARQKKGETDFINCIAFGKTAETMSQYLFKGSKVAIEGHIQTGSYTNKENHKVYTTDVVIDRFEFVGGKNEGQAPSGNQSTLGNDIVPDNDIDCPF
ncbi:single-stranded DNA-binding protein [Clostridium sp.]|uniref:single-stranded DNA-binding protein n=1 Tax=Clostridium sp. TaxID=1506 RepID=UPI0029085750|nr:single-stranded DNA-binding protein [Clostridium sp.]MDU3410660.1 single-stranded DNA-binding protein [Clostridium sp.]